MLPAYLKSRYSLDDLRVMFGLSDDPQTSDIPETSGEGNLNFTDDRFNYPSLSWRMLPAYLKSRYSLDDLRVMFGLSDDPQTSDIPETSGEGNLNFTDDHESYQGDAETTESIHMCDAMEYEGEGESESTQVIREDLSEDDPDPELELEIYQVLGQIHARDPTILILTNHLRRHQSLNELLDFFLLSSAIHFNRPAATSSKKVLELYSELTDGLRIREYVMCPVIGHNVLLEKETEECPLCLRVLPVRGGEHERLRIVTCSVSAQIEFILKRNIDDIIDLHRRHHDGSFVNERIQDFSPNLGDRFRTGLESRAGFQNNQLNIQLIVFADAFRLRNASSGSVWSCYISIYDLDDERRNCGQNVITASMMTSGRSGISDTRLQMLFERLEIEIRHGQTLSILDRHGTRWEISINCTATCMDLEAYHKTYLHPHWSTRGGNGQVYGGCLFGTSVPIYINRFARFDTVPGSCPPRNAAQVVAAANGRRLGFKDPSSDMDHQYDRDLSRRQASESVLRKLSGHGTQESRARHTARDDHNPPEDENELTYDFLIHQSYEAQQSRFERSQSRPHPNATQQTPTGTKRHMNGGDRSTSVPLKKKAVANQASEVGPELQKSESEWYKFVLSKYAAIIDGSSLVDAESLWKSLPSNVFPPQVILMVSDGQVLTASFIKSNFAMMQAKINDQDEEIKRLRDLVSTTVARTSVPRVKPDSLRNNPDDYKIDYRDVFLPHSKLWIFSADAEEHFRPVHLFMLYSAARSRKAPAKSSPATSASLAIQMKYLTDAFICLSLKTDSPTDWSLCDKTTNGNGEDEAASVKRFPENLLSGFIAIATMLIRPTETNSNPDRLEWFSEWKYYFRRSLVDLTREDRRSVFAFSSEKYDAFIVGMEVHFGKMKEQLGFPVGK